MKTDRARLAGLILMAFWGLVAGWAWTSFGLAGLVAAVCFLALVVMVALWNTTPILFRQHPVYSLPRPEHIRWPEAHPLKPSGTHKRLLFCIHGFPSTPADFRKVAAASKARGWDIAAPLLPGHGTQPEDLLSTEWSQYLAAVRDEWAKLRPQYDAACLVGTSMGGALALALAEETCGGPAAMAPSAIATIGAPAVLNSYLRHGMVKSPLLYLARFLGGVLPGYGMAFPDPEREGEDGDADWKGYLGTYTRQAYTLQVGMREVTKHLGRVTCPTLICHGRGDKMVNFENARIIESGVGSGVIEAYVATMDGANHTQHNLILYNSLRDELWSRILGFFERFA
ncbi:MAG: alpha/beta fold hydrolase [Spirochaetales bacterium]|nr:alpha/beta fold hydrolase [Spirochaetales bacterium]